VKHRHAKRADPSFEPPVEHECLREALRDTLGVVVFQDQVLDVAMAAAGFSIGEAEGLRRAMSRKRSEEAIEAFRPRFVEGCQATASTSRLRTRSTTSSSASRASASRSRTRPRSGCSRTSRRGCAATTRRSSCARC
jgi:DNA polymerase III, alpha subunit